MRIKSVLIKNYRSFEDCLVPMDDFISLVGPNGAGKSTVLCALNVFFRENENATTATSDLSAEDFFNRDTTKPIEITVTFHKLSEQAKEDFAAYARNGELVISARATFDLTTSSATVRQFGQRFGMPKFRIFFEAIDNSTPVADLKKIYLELQTEYPDIPSAATKEAMRQSLREYEDTHPEHCVLIPSEDQFYGFSKGSNRLSRHVQWIYVPAVKDASKENSESKTNTIGKLLARTVRSAVNFGDAVEQLKQETLLKYRDILAGQQGALNAISQSITDKLGQWANPNAFARLEWAEDPKRSVQVDEPSAKVIAGEGVFQGDLSRFGHGLQRSYILAILQELSQTDSTSVPTLILGCEEPELYQHPPQARHLANVFRKLADGNAQVLITTHSPYFVSGQYFESLRLVKRDMDTGRSQLTYVDPQAASEMLEAVRGTKPLPFDAHMAKLHQALQPQINEMFFSSGVVLVEGIEDAAYINSWLVLTGLYDEFRRKGYHIVQVAGKDKLISPTVVANLLGLKKFVVFDSDSDAEPEYLQSHRSDNTALLKALGAHDHDPLPEETVWNDTFVQWSTNFGKIVESEVERLAWDRAFGKARRELGNPRGDFKKNPILIGHLLAELYADRVSIPSLQKLCEKLII